MSRQSPGFAGAARGPYDRRSRDGQVLVVPLDDDEPLADLFLAGRTFADEDAALAQAAAGRMSQALRNARLYAEVRDLLRQQQESQALLVHNEKMAALGHLSAGLSRGINNSLQLILGFLELGQEVLAAKGEQGRFEPTTFPWQSRH